MNKRQKEKFQANSQHKVDIEGYTCFPLNLALIPVCNPDQTSLLCISQNQLFSEYKAFCFRKSELNFITIGLLAF